MQIGMIGPGRMGANTVRRLIRGGHACVVFDRLQAAVEELASDGAEGAKTMKEFIDRLEAPRVVWFGAGRGSG